MLFYCIYVFVDYNTSFIVEVIVNICLKKELSLLYDLVHNMMFICAGLGHKCCKVNFF